jgi:CRP-like cAMP-binding protein
MDPVSRQEELVNSHLEQNNKEAAVKLLFEMIVQCARDKNFAKAEALRARLLEVDDLALNEIIRSAEIIEEEKTQAVDAEHLTTWASLYGRLTPEESAAVYHALKHEAHEAMQSLFNQGEQHSRLYLVNRGELALLWRDGPREKVLRRIGPGETAVADGFFTDSVCTVSLVTLSRSEVAYLDRDVLAAWEKDYPAIEGKLRDFCQVAQDTPSMLRERGVERRDHNRKIISGNAAVQIFSGSWQPAAKPFRGDVADISRGGLAFLVNINDRKTARALLGRNVGFTVTIPGHEPRVKLTKKGFIVAISHIPFEGYCLHVKFNEILGQKEMDEISVLPDRQRKPL